MTLFHHNDAYELLDDGTTIRYRHGMFSHGECVPWDELPGAVQDRFEQEMDNEWVEGPHFGDCDSA